MTPAWSSGVPTDSPSTSRNNRDLPRYPLIHGV
jgi:hypothetical protein